MPMWAIRETHGRGMPALTEPLFGIVNNAQLGQKAAQPWQWRSCDDI